MKHILKNAGFLLCLLLCSCDPTLVDEPTLSPTEVSYFSNVVEFRSQLTSVYATLYDDYHFAATGYNGWVASTWLLPGDDLTESLGIRTSVELFDGTLNPNNAQLRSQFTSCYKLIARANVAIEKTRTVDYSGFPEGVEEIARMEGEALFLRGYAYFKLFNIFGSVPLVIKRLQTPEETNTPKSPALDIISQVILDTKAAIPVLPESWEPIYRGRITKNAARGLLAKALVFRGNHTGNTADFTEALAVFQTITAQLVPDYLDNFRASTENNAESLFEVQAAVPSSTNNNLNLANDGAWRGVENMSVYRGFMMEFGGRGDFNDASSTKFLITEKLRTQHGDDPRIKVFLSATDGFQGRIFQKYNKPNGTNQLSGFHGGSVNNERILRYADLKLIAAEAALKTGQAAVAIQHVNDVRQRARTWGIEAGLAESTSLPPYPAGETNATTIMQWIMNERYVELAGEGHRWWDLVRWHKGGSLNLAGWTGGLSGFSTNLASPVQFDVNKHLVFPLPQTEIDRNSNIQENNPGY
ncbi:RagB/SusD family nutrient uptake outer membrane protein [Rhabdobacter roseus]|uniref:RagB/SusD family nutrient uptake outer membrane protein n=1 Tax=Rhabdobacter roseus TaxID=1655419 RepID=A0A840TK60_9BACT|nr:RagB/SusD family nutrient uptake outer membrane protein [Rhabdobacter roseus]MBB5283804.1 hypothetical protein [Rhabdobacter roseus]